MAGVAKFASLLLLGAASGPALPTCFSMYRGDVERMCEAEERSGATLKSDPGAVEAWLQRSVASGQGVVLLNQLMSESAKDRAVQLRSEARNQSITSCKLADSYEAKAKDDDYKSAVQALCTGEATLDDGSVARLDISYAPDDAERMREIHDWTATNIKSADTQALVDRMAKASIKDRGGVLRAEATRVGVTSCALAANLDRPPPKVLPVQTSIVTLPSYTVSKVDAPSKLQVILKNALLDLAPQKVNNCYGPALQKDPNLNGSVNLKLVIETDGKVSKAEDAGSSFKDGSIVKCIADAIPSVVHVGTSVPLKEATKASATLVLSPVRGPAPLGWPALMPGIASGVPDAGAPEGGAPPAAPDGGDKDKKKKKH